MRKKLIFLSILYSWICSTPALAQQKERDSLQIKKDYWKTQAALRYPFLRMFALQTEFSGNVHYTTKLRGKDFVEGTRESRGLLKGFFTLPLCSFKKQDISVSVTYTREESALVRTINKIPQSPVSNGDYSMQNLSLFLNYKRRDSLFNKLFISGGSLILSSGLHSFPEKVSGILYGIFSLKSGPTTIITAGLLVNIDPSTLVPVLPTFSYWHKFSGSPWEISVDIPSRVMLRRAAFSKGLFSLGTELWGNILFKKLDQPLLPQNAQFGDIELRSGITLEYPVYKRVLFGGSCGLLNTFSNRLIERNKSYNDYYISGKSGAAPYINLTLSILPFK